MLQLWILINFIIPQLLTLSEGQFHPLKVFFGSMLNWESISEIEQQVLYQPRYK